MKTKSTFSIAGSLVLFALMISIPSFSQCTAGFTFTVNNASAAFTDASTGYTLPIYDWDFGDSQHDYTASPSHFYNTAGTYTVCLTVHDSATMCQNTFCLPVTVTAGCNNLSASATSVNASNCSLCDGSVTGTVTGGTSPYSYSWSNSSTATSQSSLCPGDYYLAITDAIGCVSNTNVHVGCPDSCHAQITVSNVSGNTVSFYNQSNDTASNVLFEWNFGDVTNATICNPWTHTYATSGTYTMTLIMVDSLNACTDTTTAVVVAGGPSSCSAYFNMLEDSFNLGLWYLYPSASGQPPFTYLWDFGDTTTSTQYSPTHNYTYACHHVVCFSITDANACTSSYCDSSLSHRINSSTYMQTLVVINNIATVAEQAQFKGELFPNPSSDVVNITFNKIISGTIRITDISGRTVSEQQFTGEKTQLDVKNFPEGIYNVSLLGSSEFWNERIVIIR